MIKTENTAIIVIFNIKHIEDGNIPPWTVKVKGKTYYVEHFESSVGFPPKEAPR